MDNVRKEKVVTSNAFGGVLNLYVNMGVEICLE